MDVRDELWAELGAPWVEQMLGWCTMRGHGGVRMRALVVTVNDGDTIPCSYIIDGDRFFDCPGDDVWLRYAPLPDWDDAPTLGALLGLARLACGHPQAQLVQRYNLKHLDDPSASVYRWCLDTAPFCDVGAHPFDSRSLNISGGATEAEALLRAIAAGRAR